MPLSKLNFNMRAKNNYNKKVRYRGNFVKDEVWVDVGRSTPEYVYKLKRIFGITDNPKLIKINFYANKGEVCYIKSGDVEYKFKFNYDSTESGGYFLNFTMAKPFGDDKTEIFTTSTAYITRSRKELIKILIDLLL